MGEWRNLGDLDPKHGAFMVRDARIENGAFHADTVVVIPETDVGGSDRVFDIGSGSLFLARENWASALETSGSRLEGDVILRPGLNGQEDRLEPGTQEYLDELSYATRSYCGPEYEYSTLTGIGIPTHWDATSKFPGEVVLYPDGTSLWSIMKSVTDGFDYKVNGQEIESGKPLDLDDGPYAGTPRDINSMADVAKIKGFKDLGLDAQGMPKVWKLEFIIPDDNDAPEVLLSAHELDTYNYEGEELIPSKITWRGPKEDDLCEAWDHHYLDTRQPAPEADEVNPEI